MVNDKSILKVIWEQKLDYCCSKILHSSVNLVYYIKKDLKKNRGGGRACCPPPPPRIRPWKNKQMIGGRGGGGGGECIYNIVLFTHQSPFETGSL